MQPSQKGPISDKINRAREDLAEALEDLERLPVADAGQTWTAAHSLNNYLMVTHAGVDLIRDSLGENASAETSRLLDTLLHAGQLMKKTVEQLTSGLDEVESAYLLEDVDLTLLVQRAGRFYGRVSCKKDIAIEVSTREEPCFARLDRVAFGVVLDNLLSNAVKYSPRGSTVHLTLEVEQGDLVCRVRDQGPGIDKEDQERLFEPGVRLSAQPTEGESSTGYGLSIAKRIVGRFGGRIWCESHSDQGASFCVSLPQVSAPVCS